MTVPIGDMPPQPARPPHDPAPGDSTATGATSPTPSPEPPPPPVYPFAEPEAPADEPA